MIWSRQSRSRFKIFTQSHIQNDAAPQHTKIEFGAVGAGAASRYGSGSRSRSRNTMRFWLCLRLQLFNHGDSILSFQHIHYNVDPFLG
jgi:hypothetical protein